MRRYQLNLRSHMHTLYCVVLISIAFAAATTTKVARVYVPLCCSDNITLNLFFTRFRIMV